MQLARPRARRALNRGHVGSSRGLRLAGGLGGGSAAMRVPGCGGFVAVGAWVPGVRELKVKFLQKKRKSGVVCGRLLCR